MDGWMGVKPGLRDQLASVQNLQVFNAVKMPNVDLISFVILKCVITCNGPFNYWKLSKIFKKIYNAFINY
jgi:hypothetical protein